MIQADLKQLTAEFADAKAKYFGKQDISNRWDASRETENTRKTTGVIRDGSHGDYHMRTELDLYFSAERAREADRNNPVVSPAVDQLCTNVLQHGFEADPQLGSDDDNRVVRNKWLEWCKDKLACDAQGEFTFPFLSYLVLRESIVAGDILGFPLRKGQIQLAENYRIRTPLGVPGTQRENIIHGVELDNRRKRVRYWVTKDVIAINRIVMRRDVRPLRAYDPQGNKQVFHVWHPKRSTQTRGVTKLAPPMDYLRVYGDTVFSRLVQQQGTAAYAWIRERDVDFEAPSDDAEGYTPVWDDCTQETWDTDSVKAGSVLTGLPGEKLRVEAANVPPPSYFDLSAQIEDIIGRNLALPRIIMALDASQTNFSGWRGALEQAKILFRAFQRWFADSWHTPIYQFKLRQWTDPTSSLFDETLAAIRERVGDDVFFDVEWLFPQWSYIQPSEEITGDVDLLGNSMVSPTYIQRMRFGREWQPVARQIVADRAFGIREALMMAQQLNEEFPDNLVPVTWHDLIGYPKPSRQNFSDQADLINADPEPTEPVPNGNED